MMTPGCFACYIRGVRFKHAIFLPWLGCRQAAGGESSRAPSEIYSLGPNPKILG